MFYEVKRLRKLRIQAVAEQAALDAETPESKKML
jgi:hypothetical protein